MNAPLSPEENQILAELIQLAEGVGRTKDVKTLSGQQLRIASILIHKGRVVMTSRKFMVIDHPR
jgi:hypothetical protein